MYFEEGFYKDSNFTAALTKKKKSSANPQNHGSCMLYSFQKHSPPLGNIGREGKINAFCGRQEYYGKKNSTGFLKLEK